MFIDHPVLRPERIQFRGYQVNLARVAAERDTLVVLPTGMGKTVVALLCIADALRDGAKRILLMAPTKPLVEQHAHFLQDVLREPWCDEVQCLTGAVAPDKRAAAYADAGIVCATPQVVHNDLIAGRMQIGDWQWLVFDEAHRAVGDYPYVFIGQESRKAELAARRAGGASRGDGAADPGDGAADPGGAGARGRPSEGRPMHRLGLTASPGHDVRKIEEVRHELGLRHVEIRTPADGDVREYVQDVRIEWETLPLPPTMARVSRLLHDALSERVRSLKQAGLLTGAKKRPTRMQLLEVGKKVQVQLRQRADAPPELYQALSVQAQAMKILHAIELAETQGSAALREFMERMRREVDGPKASKATRVIVADKAVNEAYQVARHDTKENPKLGRIQTLIQAEFDRGADARVIVFAHYRDTCEQVADALRAIDGVRPKVFVGQGKRAGKDGLTQKQQAEILDAFRAGTHNVLVATSVAEEGLDIPQTDLVVFYEPIPSEIRSIQRRGRTGRNREGRVVVLMTKGTQDEAAHWSARRREQQMVQELQDLRRTLARTGAGGSPEGEAGAAAAGAAHPAGGGAVGPVGGGGQRRLDDPRAAAPGAQAPAGSAPPTMGEASGGSRAAPGRTPTGTAPTDADRGTEPVRLGNGPLIVCDHRENAGGVVRHLHQMGVRVEARQLDTGDFILSDRVAVERKECADFVDSLLDGRIFEQVKALQVYQKPFLVIEGESLMGHRNVAPEALQGALASITIDYGVPVMQTRDPLETARCLAAVAKREQGRAGRKVAVRPGKVSMGDEERLLFILSGFPGVSGTLAKRLLAHFGTLRGVVTASPEALAEVEGVGPKTAAEMHRLLDLARSVITETV